MRLLVVGATGFVGSELIQFARACGHTVRGCGRSSWKGKGAEYFEDKDYWSINNGPIPDSFIQGVDATIILAAQRPYQGFGYKDYANNVQLVNDIMELSYKNNVKKIVFASTKAVYSGEGMPWKENMKTEPLSLYGASKLASEELGMYYSRKHNLDFIVLRLAQVIGAYERKGYLVNTLIDNARERKPLVLFGDGSQRRHYIYVKDVCRAIIKALEVTSGIYNIGMEKSISNRELAETINDIFDNPCEIEFDTSKQMYGSDDEMDVTKAKEEMGYVAEYDLKRMINDIKEIYKNEEKK